jgi:drug/metabolite transporter (DMT)-like permease
MEQLEVDEQHHDHERDESRVPVPSYVQVAPLKLFVIPLVIRKTFSGVLPADMVGRRMTEISTKDSRPTREALLRGIALASLSAVCFGTLPIFAKYAYQDGADPLALLAARFITSTILLAVFAAITKRPVALPHPRALRIFLLGAIGYASESALFFAALTRAPAAVVSLVFYSYPLWTNIGGFATGLEKFQARSLVALGLAGTGIALIFSLPDTPLAGLLLALASALAVTVYYLFAQVFVRKVDPLPAAIHTAAGAGLSLTVASLATGERLPAAAFPEAAGLGSVTAVAFVCLYAALAAIGSAKTATTHMLEPVTTVLLAAVLLGDEISGRVAVGAALIVSALPILAGKKRDRPLVE